VYALVLKAKTERKKKIQSLIHMEYMLVQDGGYGFSVGWFTQLYQRY